MTQPTTTTLGQFAVGGTPPPDARARAAAAFLDTVGVALAGSTEPVARIVQQTFASESTGGCLVWGTGARLSASDAALANGTAAHALDYDDMCFVSLAHPSAPLVPAALAAAEAMGSSGRDLLDAYVVGFEIEGRLGRLMNPRHYQRGWHCTSTLGAIGVAAAVSRLLRLTAEAAGQALAIAASEASGLKENFGSMVKPLHAGLAARNGVLAAVLAENGLTASRQALDGPQGFLHAFDSQGVALDAAIEDLGRRWEIIDTGITVKLYPSCAGTHPTLDALLDLRLRHVFTPDEVSRIDIDVDAITPTVLIYDRPRNGLEAKFSMPFCAAAAIIDGEVGIESFEPARLADRATLDLMSRVTMHATPEFEGSGPPLTQARVRVSLFDGRRFTQSANGARGYPERPATEAQVRSKFLGCARRVLPAAKAEQAFELLRRIEGLGDARALTALLQP